MQTQISGSGYGYSHTWIKGGTNQMPVGYFDKSTYWQCSECKAAFNHHYDVIHDIFEAIRHAGVVDKCPGKPSATNK